MVKCNICGTKVFVSHGENQCPCCGHWVFIEGECYARNTKVRTERSTTDNKKRVPKT